jgi:hypothetical protein
VAASPLPLGSRTALWSKRAEFILPTAPNFPGGWILDFRGGQQRGAGVVQSARDQHLAVGQRPGAVSRAGRWAFADRGGRGDGIEYLALAVAHALHVPICAAPPSISMVPLLSRVAAAFWGVQFRQTSRMSSGIEEVRGPPGRDSY